MQADLRMAVLRGQGQVERGFPSRGRTFGVWLPNRGVVASAGPTARQADAILVCPPCLVVAQRFEHQAVRAAQLDRLPIVSQPRPS